MKQFAKMLSGLTNSSLPVRERGLKLFISREVKDETVSLPVRERGLKLDDDMAHQPVETSLPVRERGLKRATVGTRRVRACRSPRGSDLCGLILS